MTRTISRIDMESALEAANVYSDVIRDSYEGRGYAKEGFGVVVENVNQMFTAFTALGFLAGENYADGAEGALEDGTVYDLAAAAHMDNMGYDTIVYFPGWTLA